MATLLDPTHIARAGRVRAVVLNFNKPEMTLHCVESLSSQSYAPIDIVVVDNGSSLDNFERLRRTLPRHVRLLRLGSNVGYASGNNAGVREVDEMSRPAFVWILNNDLVLRDSETAGNLVKALLGNPRRVAVSPLVRDPRSSADPAAGVQVRRVPNFLDLIVAYSSWLSKFPGLRRTYEHHVYRDLSPLPLDVEIDCETVNGSCFMARMDFVEAIGYFDEGTFLYFEELILGWQMKEAGANGCLTTAVTVDHFQGSTSEHGAMGFKTAMFREEVRSQAHYARRYLGISDAAVWLLFGVRTADAVVRALRHVISRLRFFR